ncbi:MAG: hypothetical protein P8Y36_13950, partial [Alphaproteobacteria bacterium]
MDVVMPEIVSLPDIVDSDIAFFVTAITIGLSLVSVLHTMMTNWYHRQRQKVSRAVELYEEFYSVGNYTSVVAPVFEVMLKWNGLSEPQKTHYRKAIIDGWIGFHDGADNVWRKVVCLPQMKQLSPEDESELQNTIIKQHYTSRPSTSTSEHDALT